MCYNSHRQAMAQKKPAPRKSSSKPAKPGAKTAPPGKAAAGKNAGSGKTRHRPLQISRRGSGSTRKPKKGSLPFSRHKAPFRPFEPAKSAPVRQGLSLDRKLDILGIVLALAGLLTLLSMLSPINGSLTGGWVAALGMTFGWGMYLFPIGLMATGLWLVLRNFERCAAAGCRAPAGPGAALPEAAGNLPLTGNAG